MESEQYENGIIPLIVASNCNSALSYAVQGLNYAQTPKTVF